MENTLIRRIGKIIMASVDIALLHFGFLAAFYFRFGGFPEFNFDPYIQLLPWLSIVALVIFYFFDCYSYWSRKSFYKFIYSVCTAVAIFIMLTMAISFLYRGFSFPRSVILLGGVLQILLVVTVRLIAWYLLRTFNGKKKVLIVGRQFDDGLAIAEKFLSHTEGWFEVKKFIAVEDKGLLNRVIPHIDVILLDPSLSVEEKSEVMSYSFRHGKEVLIVPDLYELFILGADIQQVDDMPVLSIVSPRLTSLQLVVKRAFDLTFALLILAIMSPVMLLLLIVIPLTSKGKAIYTQERLGLNQKHFLIYKFRSMVNDAERKTGPVFASEQDNRVTPLGRLLRATRLDELPQLINVIKGDMSLVGPRPEREFFVEQFKEEISDYVYRMTVKPGVTGLAQVMAKYNTDVEDKLRYDLIYIRNYSFLSDLKILLQTSLVMFQSEHSAGVRRHSYEIEVMKKILGGRYEVAVGKNENPKM